MGTAATAFVGIDVSKATLDACLLGPDGRAREAAFTNDSKGHAALIAWADQALYTAKRGGRDRSITAEARSAEE